MRHLYVISFITASIILVLITTKLKSIAPSAGKTVSEKLVGYQNAKNESEKRIADFAGITGEYKKQKIGESYEIVSPVMGKLMKMIPGKGERVNAESLYETSYRIISFISDKLKFAGAIYLIAGIIMGVLVMGLNINSAFIISSLLGKIGFFIGRFTMILASIAVVVYYVIFEENLWNSSGINLFLGPLQIILGASLILKCYDFNFPIISRMLTSLIFPAFAAISIIVRSYLLNT